MLMKIPIVSELLDYTQDFLGSLCGLIGLTIAVATVVAFLYIRKRKRDKEIRYFSRK